MLAKAKAEGENLSKELERIKLQVNKANTEVLSKELALERAQQRNINWKRR